MPSTITQGIDVCVTIGDTRPGDPGADQALLSNTTVYLAKFPRGFADFAVLSADIWSLYAAAAAASGVQLRLQLIGEDWQASQVTGATLPATIGTPVNVTLGALTAGASIDFAITSLMQQVANGTVESLGVMVTRLDAGAALPVWTYQAAALNPTQVVSYNFKLPTPTRLSPAAGRAVSAAKVLLRVLDYATELDDQGISAMRVQWSATSSFTGTLLADDTLSVTTPAFDMNLAASGFALPLGFTRYWRTQIQNAADGSWSDWSQPEATQYLTIPPVAFTFPSPIPGQNVSPDPDPQVTWAFTGTQTAYRLTREALTDSSILLADTRPQPSAAKTASANYEVTDYSTYIDRLTVWDNVAREDIPGAPAYAQTSVAWSVVDDGALKGPQMGALTLLDGDSPFPVIPWTHGSLQDFRVRRRESGDTGGGKNISGLLKGKTVLVNNDEGGYHYQWIDFSAAPGVTYDYRVQVVTAHRGSALGDVASILTGDEGVYLANPATQDWMQLFDVDFGEWLRPEPNSAFYGPLNGSAYWRRARGNRLGISSRITGDLWPDGADQVTVNAQQRSFDSMANSDDDLVLVTPHEVFVAAIGNTSSTPLDDPFQRPRHVAFDVRQTGRSTMLKAPDDPGQTLETRIDFESWTNGATITTADPSLAISGVTGNIVADSTAAMHGSKMGCKLVNTTGGCFLDVVSNPLESTISVSSKGISALPTGPKSLLRWAHTGTAIGNVRIGTAGTFQVVDASGTQVAKSIAKIVAGQAFKLQAAATWYNGFLYPVIRLFIGLNTDGDNPTEVIQAPPIAAVSVPDNSIRVGAISTPGFDWQIDDIQILNNTGSWPINYGDPSGAVEDEFTFIGPPTATGVLIAHSMVGSISVALLYSTHSDMSSASLSTAATPDANGIVKHTLSGLTPNTKYYTQLATAAGVAIGDIGIFTTQPTSGAVSRAVILDSCQGNSGDPSKYDVGMPAWAQMLNLGFDFQIQQGDFGYWGATLAGTDPPAKHIDKYRKQLANLSLMRQAFLNAPSIIQVSDHETSPNNGDTWAGDPVYGPIVRNAIDAYTELMPIAPSAYGDTRTPIQGRWFACNLIPNVRLISCDFRSLERTPSTWDDTTPANNPGGATKTAYGSAQLAWLLTELRRPEPLKVILSDVAWGPAASTATLAANGQADDDKWWCYQTTQKLIAQMISGNLTTTGHPIQVDFWGGDRHALGWLAQANNTLADGTPVGFDALLASGTDKNGLEKVTGEKYDADYGFNPLNGGGGGVQTEPRQFGHIVVADNGTNQITRTFNGWSCADPTILATQPSYTPVVQVGPKVKTWSY